MSKNDRHAASESWKLSSSAVVLAAMAPLTGCILPDDLGEGLGEAIGEGLADAFGAAHADVQVNALATETRVGACVSHGLPLPGACKGDEDRFYFLDHDEWQNAPTGVAPLPEGTELTVYWSSPEGKATFTVSLPPAPAISAPAADAAFHLGDTITLQFADPGADEVTIESEGSCAGDAPTNWLRILARDDATPGQLVVRADEIVHSRGSFERCDVTLRVTRARPGTMVAEAEHMYGTITARSFAEVALQVVP
jgi:hypothetical protein